MLKIGVLNSKGGVGKSLIATAIAVRAAQDSPRVGIVDLDPQQGAKRWWRHRGETENPTLLAGEPIASEAVEKLRFTGWDIAIFDGAPGALEATEDAIKAVDLVVCPLRASDQDLGSTEYVVSACRDFGTPILLVVNCATPRGDDVDKRSKEVHALLERASKQQPGMHVFSGFICQRVPYVDAMNVGKSAAEIKGGEAAKAEIDKLYKEVMALAQDVARREARVG